MRRIGADGFAARSNVSRAKRRALGAVAVKHVGRDELDPRETRHSAG